MREVKFKTMTRGVGSYARQIILYTKQYSKEYPNGRDIVIGIIFPWCKQIAVNPLSGYEKIESYSTKEYWEELKDDYSIYFNGGRQ